MMNGFPLSGKGLCFHSTCLSTSRPARDWARKSNLVAQEGGCATPTSVPAAHPRLCDKCGKSKRQISTSRSDPVFLEVLVITGLRKHHLYLTLSLISNSSSKTNSVGLISVYLCMGQNGLSKYSPYCVWLASFPGSNQHKWGYFCFRSENPRLVANSLYNHPCLDWDWRQATE